MPSVTAAIEYLKHLESKGRGNAPVHIVDIEEEAKERSKNAGPKPKTRFQVELDDPSLYCQFNFEKDRIFARVKNKPIALDFMYRAWRDALSDKELDRMLAEQEAPE
jgi:hypothetical protein